MDPRTRHERALASGILRLGRTYRREVDRALAKHGLSDASAEPVLYIARLGEGARQGAVAEAMGVEGPSLVRQLDYLCGAGLVERRDDPNDRRAKTLHLTSAGRDMAGVVEEVIRDMRGRMLADVDDTDLEAALRVLGRFEAGVRAGKGR